MTTANKIDLISVDEALAKGRQMLFWPRLLLIIGLFFFLFPVMIFGIALKDGPTFSINVWMSFGGAILFCFIIGFCLPFLWLSKRTTRWKLWAFGHVTDVKELKIAARRAALCAGYGTLMDKLQVQSPGEREQWRQLQARTGMPDIFIDDTGTPAETIIYYSTPALIIHIMLGLIFMAIGVVILYSSFGQNPSAIVQIFGAAMVLAPFYLIIRTLIDLIRHQPRIIFNNKGIFTPETGFQNWDNVIGGEVEIINQGRRGVKHSLHFQYPGGLANIDVTAYSKRNQLESLMRIYRGRFKSTSSFNL